MIRKVAILKNKLEEIVSSNNLDSKNASELSITEAAKLSNVTRQAIYVAIKLNKLKAKKDTTRWTISLADLDNYRKQRYSRSKSTYNGELIYDAAKGFYSINQVARMLKVPTQKIYYATRIGLLKAHRKGAAWVIHADDIAAYQTQCKEKQAKRRQSAS